VLGRGWDDFFPDGPQAQVFNNAIGQMGLSEQLQELYKHQLKIVSHVEDVRMGLVAQIASSMVEIKLAIFDLKKDLEKVQAA